ncbi:hypothetical protein M404DRAFT_999138, partial [Pisolithus tinctorius Marx 270]
VLLSKDETTTSQNTLLMVVLMPLQGIDEVIEVVNHNQQDDKGWDATLLMLSNGLDCP